ncbi:MAG: DUF1553 domain-containing protein, partial [Planctomycetaceae bacterium]|nr:DUF1553 domain-containing protein [Planctomycetaceae bacterium]
YRRLEAEIRVPTRVPGLDETVGTDHPLFERGNHKRPADLVPRRFLEAVDSTAYDTTQSGRLQLAENLLRDDNPLTRRVIVNRVWHHVFGQGLVSTPDNFGRLGDQPSHPDLLDHLALQFQHDGWSLKRLIRQMVTSTTWQLSSEATPQAMEIDPENRLLSHANVRRLEAEAIRDQLLSVSGLLEFRSPDDMSLGANSADGDSPQRSVYLRVRRNSLEPFLRAFDFPEPFAAVGRRDVTNVPAQSLTMMNDARIQKYAARWAESVTESAPNDNLRVHRMLLTAFSRQPMHEETELARQYLQETQQQLSLRQQEKRRLLQAVEDYRIQRSAVTEPVRKSLVQAAKDNESVRQAALPQPIAVWDFSRSERDRIGSADVELHNGAVLADGALVVRKGGYAVTKPLPQTLRAKTLEAWVRLDNLNQRAGGVMTIQTPDGVFFDSIVFAERDPRRWLAGSNNFARTQPFGGPAEDQADKAPVHVAVVYHSDGTVIGYRNGKPYGRSYVSNGPFEFQPGQSVISFGVRHLPPVGNRLLSGQILRANLYDRALSADEIAATSGTAADFVSEEQLMAALSPEDCHRTEALTKQIQQTSAALQLLSDVPDEISDGVLYTELARAIFTMQEFIYLR